MKFVHSLVIFSTLALSCQSQFINFQKNLHLRQQQLQLSPDWEDGLKQRLEKVNQNRAPDEIIDIHTVLQTLIRLLKGPSFPTAVAKNISQQCIDDSKQYLQHLTNFTPWARQSKKSFFNNISYK